MRTLRMAVCSLVAGAAMLGGGSAARANGLVGMNVYRHPFGHGLLINSFIPGTSAYDLWLQGELYPGDIVTRYNGRRVFSIEQVWAISSRAFPGEWLVMEFVTPDGLPFWHYVQPGGMGRAPVGPMSAGRVHAPMAAHGAPGPASAQFRVGQSRSRPGGAAPQPGHPHRVGRPDDLNQRQDPGHHPGPGRPQGSRGPQGPGRPGALPHPRGPGRP